MNFLPNLTIDQKSSKLYHLDLVHNENAKGHIPIITFLDLKKNELILNPEELDIKGSELVKDAFQNLNQIDVEWVQEKINSILFLRAEHQQIGSEKILDRAFLTTAQNILKTDSLAIAIPNKGTIYCCDCEADAVSTMEDIVSSSFNSYQNTPLSNCIYIVSDGIITDIFEVDFNDELAYQEVTKSENFDYSITKMSIYQELFSIKILIGCNDFNELYEKLQQVIKNSLAEYGNKVGFNGSINLQSEEGKPEKTDQNIKALFSYFDRLKNDPILTNFTTKDGKKISIHFQFGIDFNQGNINNKYTLNF